MLKQCFTLAGLRAKTCTYLRDNKDEDKKQKVQISVS